MDLIKHIGYNDFIDYNQNVIEGNEFEYFHLLDVRYDLENGTKKFLAVHNLKNEYNNIMFLQVEQSDFVVWYLYPNVWNHESIEWFGNNLRQSQYKILAIKGNRDYIVKLTADFNFNYNEINHRLIFSSKDISYKLDSSNFIVRKAELSDLLEIQLMHRHYYHEDFPNGQATTDSLDQTTQGNILNGNIYLIENAKGEIIAKTDFCEIASDKIWISNIFTKEPFRGQGYATKLILFLT